MMDRRALIAAARASDEIARREERALLNRSFSAFVRAAWPIVEPGQRYVHGKHIDVISEYLEAQATGEITDLCINVPPGCMKSLLCSVMYQPWVWGEWPESRWLCMSYSSEVIERDTQKVSAIVTSPWYQRLWGDKFRIERASLTKIQNSVKGERRGASLLGQGTGQGGEFMVIDDPLKSDDALSDAKRYKVNHAFRAMVSSRQRPPGSGARLLIMQRLHHDDPSATVLDWGWEHLCLPMEFETHHPIKCSADWRKKDGELLWPELFNEAVVTQRKKEMSLPQIIAGQYQQRPTIEGGGVLKEYWWQAWTPEKLPPPEMIIQSWDTALSSSPEAAESACTTWMVFYPPSENPFGHETDPCLMLLHAESGRWEFPDLVAKAQELAERFNPDRLLIEEKASGFSLIQELKRSLRKRADILVPIKIKQDKITRAHAVSTVFSSERVFAIWDNDEDKWMPDAAAVIRQCSEFPRGALKDLVDSTTQAINWVRKNNIVKSEYRDLDDDDYDDDTEPRAPIYGT